MSEEFVVLAIWAGTLAFFVVVAVGTCWLSSKEGRRRNG